MPTAGMVKSAKKMDWRGVWQTAVFFAILIAIFAYLSSGRLEGWFHSEEEAQHHCPSDIVVWLNTRSGIYHLKGERWYGQTQSGAYMCMSEANAAGDQLSENG